MRITKENHQEVINLYNSGKTLKELAQLFNCKSYGPVKLILKKQGIKLRKKGELRAKGKYSIDENYFSIIDSHEKSYWLGFIVADGCIQKSSNDCISYDKLSFTLNQDDNILLCRFKKHINCDHKISNSSVFDKRTQKYYHRSMLRIGCKTFVEKLINLGITSEKSTNCEFPQIPEELYSSFIRGLIDGDGWVSDEKSKFSLIATTQILNFISKIFQKKFNWQPTVFQPITDKHNLIMKMYVYAQSPKILSWIYEYSTEETRLDRKYQSYLLMINRTIKKPGRKPKF